MAEFLLDSGADVNAQDKGGLIPLHNASSYGVGILEGVGRNVGGGGNVWSTLNTHNIFHIFHTSTVYKLEYMCFNFQYFP